MKPLQVPDSVTLTRDLAACQTPKFTLYNRREVLTMLECSDRTLRRKIAAGTFPPPVPGERNLWTAYSLIQWVSGEYHNGNGHKQREALPHQGSPLADVPATGK
jgi:predicted DNA-binding transcriptional regulator AlpA